MKARGDGLAKTFHRVGGALERVGGNFAQDGFEFGEHLLDGIEIGTVGREVDQNCAARLDRLFHAGNLVDADVVHEHDIASLEGWSKNLFDIGAEGFAVHRSFKHEGRSDAVMAQRGDECGGLPIAVDHLLDQTLALRCPAVEPGDIAGNGGFIEENQPFRIKPRLPLSQRLARGGDVRPILLGGVQAFF